MLKKLPIGINTLSAMLETTFAGHLAGVDWAQLKTWYNGYQFLGEAVYNPYDILLFISGNQRYRNYWFETGNPSFLIKLFQQKAYFCRIWNNWKSRKKFWIRLILKA
jgi:hypothetical protein